MKFLFTLFVSFSLQAYTFQEANTYSKEVESIEYPYKNLEENTLKVFLHGSLVDYKSAAKTFSKRSLSTRVEALAFGLKRAFDRDVPISTTPHWGTPSSLSARGMLNVHPTHSPGDSVNGILMDITPDDFDAMRARERGYNLIPVVVVIWEEYLNEQCPSYIVAYTFHAPKESPYTSRSILPRPGYYELVRDAAKRVSPSFYKHWVNSTYLADLKTPISKWETSSERNTLNLNNINN